MMGGILGGSASMRFGEAVRQAEMESCRGRQVLIVSGVPKTFPLRGSLPEILAPGYEGNRPVDVLAECYGAVRGVSGAESFFVNSVLSGEGGGVHRTSNDVYWFESMRAGLAALFRAAGILAAGEGKVRSLSRVLCGCFYDLNNCVGRAAANSAPSRPQWMDKLPEDVQRPLALNYLGKATPATYSHLSTLMATVEELGRAAPREWTEPFVISPGGRPLFVYAPAWESAACRVLLQVCVQRGYYLLLPELHLWPEREIHRMGYFLQSAAKKTDCLWTSSSVPLHPGFDTDWEIFGKSGALDVQGYFRARLNAIGVEGETRLKELQFETPASLDESHALLRTLSGWRADPCASFEERLFSPLERPRTALGGESLFEENLAELAGREHEYLPGMEYGERISGTAIPPEQPAAFVRLVRGVPRVKDGACTMDGANILLKDVSVSANGHAALLAAKTPDPQPPVALYETAWTAAIPPEKEVSRPRVDAFLPVLIGKSPSPVDGVMEAYSSLFRENVRLILCGWNDDFRKGFYTAFGTWIEPRKTFLVRSLLKPVLPEDGKVPFLPRNAGVWGAVQESAEKLRSFLNGTLKMETEASGEAVLSPEDRKELTRLRSAYETMASLAMETLHNGGTLEERLERKGFVQIGLDALDTSGKSPEALCAIDSSGWLPADYRERLRKNERGEDCVRAFDGVFASLLLNLDTRKLP